MVQSFCCCNLRIGGQAIGWISIFLCIYKLIDAIYKLITVDDPSAKDDPFRKKSIVEFSIGAVVVALVMNIFLLLGIKKIRPGYVLPWLVLCFLEIVSITVGSIYTLGKDFIGLTGLSIIIIMILPIYSWLVIFSLYKEIKYQSTHLMRQCNVV